MSGLIKDRWDKLTDLIRGARTSPLKRSMLLSAMCKPVSMIIAFFYTPFLIRCLGDEAYGVWATILSVINWINYFDIGIGLGMRNTLTTYITGNEKAKAREVSSTGYMALSLISGVTMLIGMILVFVLDTGKLFNTALNVRPALLVSFICVCINFVLGLVKVQLYAIQRAEKVGFLNLWVQIINIICVWLLTLSGRGDLLWVAVIVGASGVIVNAVYSGSLWHKFDFLRPSVSAYQRSELKNVCGIGIKFFILQINALVIFATDNMIITQILGPVHVTPYQTTYTAFGLVNGLFAAFIAPLWSRYTEAQEQRDHVWIKRSIFKLDAMLPAVAVILLIGVIFYRPLAFIWLHKELDYPSGLIPCMALFFFLQILNSIYTTVLNGVGLIDLEMWLGIASAIANIPLSVFFGRNLHMGTTGVLLATLVCVFVMTVAQMIQVHLYLNRQIRLNKTKEGPVEIPGDGGRSDSISGGKDDE